MGGASAQGWPATLEDFWSWHVEAACRGTDTMVFFSPEGERGPAKARRERAAKAVCARCPVVDVCAAYALASREPYGTWGGMSEADRRMLLARLDPWGTQLAYRRALADWEARAGDQSA